MLFSYKRVLTLLNKCFMISKQYSLFTSLKNSNIYIRNILNEQLVKNTHLRYVSHSSTMGKIVFTAPIPENRYNDVMIHLRYNFFVNEPLTQSVGLCKNGEPHEELEAYVLNTLINQLSVMAVDKASDKLVAVGLNGLELPGNIEQEKKDLENIRDKKFKQIITLLYDVNHSLDLFSKYKVDKIMNCRMASVDSDYQKAGLGKQLLSIAEDLAKADNFKLMLGEATSAFSQKFLLSLGWKTVYELKYKDYVNENGEPIFNPPLPHVSLKIMVQDFKK